MPTRTVEDYLKRLYLQEQTLPGTYVAMGKLAAAMDVVPGTATTMVKALAESGLVAYEPRTGVRLTRAGEQLALHVLRRHRLVELFLVKTLGLDWAEVHDEAEELEHAISERVLARIDLLLGRPSVDPHGDPIPPATGRPQPPTPRPSLATCPVRKSHRVSRILDQERPFLQFVERCGLTPGTVVIVDRRDEAADAVLIRPRRRKAITLGYAAAAKVLVQRVR